MDDDGVNEGGGGEGAAAGRLAGGAGGLGLGLGVVLLEGRQDDCRAVVLRQLAHVVAVRHLAGVRGGGLVSPTAAAAAAAT